MDMLQYLPLATSEHTAFIPAASGVLVKDDLLLTTNQFRFRLLRQFCRQFTGQHLVLSIAFIGMLMHFLRKRTDQHLRRFEALRAMLVAIAFRNITYQGLSFLVTRISVGMSCFCAE